ncbi:MAG: alginate export family protein [Pseudoxanthomonas sp.]
MTLALVVTPGVRAQAARKDESYPMAGQGLGGKTGPETWMSRWAEDWSFLRDKRKRKNALDALKYVPLNDSGDTYLSFSMEQRLRGDYYSAIGLREGAPSQAPEMYRLFMGADLHVGEHFRAFTELAHASINGHGVTTRAALQEDDARVQQAFFDVTGKWNSADVGVRIGRQDFTDGPQWLMTTRENANMHFTLDGARAWAMTADKRVDVYELRYVAESTGAFDDGTDSGRRLRGVTLGMRLPVQGELFLEPFWINARDDAKRWGAQVAKENRDLWGLHVYGTRGALTLDTAAMVETGDFGHRDIRAFGAYSSFRWALSKEGIKPQVGFHADITSGGGGYDSGTLRNGTLLYGALPYFSWATWFGGANYIDLAPTFQFAPTATTTVAVEYQRMWRQREDDAVYTGPGAAYAGTQHMDGRHIGDLLRLNATWRPHRHVSLTARAERFVAGDAMEDAGYGDATFVGGWVTFRF